jgi:competence protein ComEA
MLLTAKPVPQPFNLNTATAAQIKTLPGAGDTMAAAIIHYREKNGPFRRVEDLLIIKGVSKQRLESWKPYLKLK